MGLVTLTCPACGAKLENVDDSRETFFCTYCGNKITYDKTIIEHRGSVSLTGVANENSLLRRADMFLSEGSFSDADEYYDRVLDINPECAKAYMGQIMAALRVKSLEELRDDIDEDFSEWNEYKHALMFSDGEEKKRYEDVNGPKHQFLLGLHARERNIEEGKKQIQKEQDQTIEPLMDQRNALERTNNSIQRTLANLENQKASLGSRFAKMAIKNGLITLGVILLYIILGSSIDEPVVGFLATFALIVFLITRLVRLLKDHKRVYGKFRPKKEIDKNTAQYNNNVATMTAITNQMNQIGCDYNNRMNSFVATVEQERQQYIMQWNMDHPEDPYIGN